jgi:hypothetical protein
LHGRRRKPLLDLKAKRLRTLTCHCIQSRFPPAIATKCNPLMPFSCICLSKFRNSRTHPCRLTVRPIRCVAGASEMLQKMGAPVISLSSRSYRSVPPSSLAAQKPRCVVERSSNQSKRLFTRSNRLLLCGLWRAPPSVSDRSNCLSRSRCGLDVGTRQIAPDNKVRDALSGTAAFSARPVAPRGRLRLCAVCRRQISEDCIAIPPTLNIQQSSG